MTKPITDILTLQGKRIVLILLILTALPLLYYSIPIGQDWIEFFRPATLALIHGENPYEIRDFHNAPWTLIPFIPFALMPYQLGRAGLFLLGFGCFLFVALKLKAKPVSVILFVTSYPVISCLNGGGIDWLPMLSFVTPAPLSLIFAAMKPQIGVGIAIYWFFESWRIGGIQTILKNFLPVTILLLASFALYGFWILTFIGKSQNAVNMSLFPYSVPLALYLLWVAVTQQRAKLSMAAGPFLAPYHTLFSLAAPLVAFFDYPKLFTLVSVCLWMHGVFHALTVG